MKLPLVKSNAQAGRFAVVGAASTLIDFAILFGLKALGLPAITSNIVSTGVAFVFSFAANKTYTFKTTGNNVVKEMILFVVFTLIGLWVFQSVIIYLTNPYLETTLQNKELALFISKLLATVVSTIWNYLTYSRLVFKKH